VLGALLFVLSVTTRLEVIETAPQGSALDVPELRSALEVLPELFAEAESSIDVAQMYMLYYPPESRGRQMYALYDGLIAAARRGVKVRVLLDSTTLEGSSTETYQRMGHTLAAVPGVEVRACDLRPMSAYDGCIMHAKYCIIDRAVAVVGSHNWSFAAFTDNREISLVVRDTGFCRGLGAVFATDWCAGRGEKLPTSPGGPGNLVVTSPARLKPAGPRSTIEALGDVIGQAESAVDVEVNSISDKVLFGGGERFAGVESLLFSAARRGVRVRLLVDKWAEEQDSTLLVRLDSAPGIEVRVIDLSALGPNPGTGSCHAKLVIADGRRALVGSATLSQRQVLECRNVGVLVEEPRTVGLLGRVFETDWQSEFCRRP